MSESDKPSPDVIANVALQLTIQIANTNSSPGISNANAARDVKKYYLDLYKDCYSKVKRVY